MTRAILAQFRSNSAGGFRRPPAAKEPPGIPLLSLNRTEGWDMLSRLQPRAGEALRRAGAVAVRRSCRVGIAKSMTSGLLDPLEPLVDQLQAIFLLGRGVVALQVRSDLAEHGQ